MRALGRPTVKYHADDDSREVVGRVIAKLTVVAVVFLICPPSAAKTQPAGKIAVVALVAAASPVSQTIGPEPTSPATRAFVQAMRDAGWVEGRNIVIERRSAEGQPERLPAI